MDGNAPAATFGRAAAARKLQHAEAEAERARSQVATKDRQLEGLQVRCLIGHDFSIKDIRATQTTIWRSTAGLL